MSKIESKKLESLLALLLKADQENRIEKANQGVLANQDRAHYIFAKTILSAKVPLSSKANYTLAMILHHAGTVHDLSRAHTLAERAATQGYPKAWWLSAAIFDRRCIMQNKPQRYGTQFKQDKETGKLRLAPIDDSCTDVERQQRGLPTLAQIRSWPNVIDG